MLKIGLCVLIMMIAVPAKAEEPAPADLGMTALRSRIADERARVDQLHILQLEVQRLKLELEKKKAAAELGRADGPANGSSASAAAQDPAVLRYVLIAGERKEALFEADGVKRQVHEGDELGGRVVKAILSDGVVLKSADGQETRSLLRR